VSWEKIPKDGPFNTGDEIVFHLGSDWFFKRVKISERRRERNEFTRDPTTYFYTYRNSALYQFFSIEKLWLSATEAEIGQKFLMTRADWLDELTTRKVERHTSYVDETTENFSHFIEWSDGPLTSLSSGDQRQIESYKADHEKKGKEKEKREADQREGEAKKRKRRRLGVLLTVFLIVGFIIAVVISGRDRPRQQTPTVSQITEQWLVGQWAPRSTGCRWDQLFAFGEMSPLLGFGEDREFSIHESAGGRWQLDGSKLTIVVKEYYEDLGSPPETVHETGEFTLEKLGSDHLRIVPLANNRLRWLTWTKENEWQRCKF
jgi:hypothetical protein